MAEMHIVKVVKSFASVKNKNGERKYGFNPSINKFIRLNDHDYNLFKKDGLIEDVAEPPKTRTRAKQ